MCVVLEGVLASLQLEAQDFQVRLLELFTALRVNGF
jgi:hypothetical protein